MRPTTILAVTLSLALVGCGNGKAPSEKLKDATEELVEEASGEVVPPLAEGPYAPRDECVGLPGAYAYRERIRRALAAPDVKLDFGGGAGSAELKARLDGEQSNLWRELDALLAMGCAAEGEASMTLPWYFSQEIDEVDPMMGMIVTGEGVPLLLAPERDSDVLEAISWDVVQLVDGFRAEDRFPHVETTKDKRGYIATDRLRSLIDYRLLASSRDGKWSITSLVAGD